MDSQPYIETDRYVTDSFFQKEQNSLFSKLWLFAGISSRLPQPQSHFVFTTPQHSFLITRDEKGKVHAFFNNCLHRGTQLASKSGKGPIRCPYHGWKYKHDGRLEEVAKPDKLLSVPCNQGRLRKIHCMERSGMIWVSTAESPPELDTELDAIFTDLEGYRFEEFSPVEARDFRFPVNWKIVMENSLDFYHVAFAHSSSVNAHVNNGPSFETLGRHNLQSLFIAPYPWRSWIDARTSRGGPYTQKQKQSLHKYFLFPNLVLNVLPYHITIMQFWPIDVNRCWLRYRFCLRKGAGLLERARVYATWLASRWILYEDVRLYSGIQVGMKRSPFSKQPLHEEERAIQHFHDQLSKIIES